MTIIPILSQAAFDPDMTQILVAAFETAWRRLQDSGSPLALDDTAAATRDALARTIIAVAQTGERDENRLVEAALGNLVRDPAGPLSPFQNNAKE